MSPSRRPRPAAMTRAAALVLLGALFLAGCGKSAPTRFYSLSAKPLAEGEVPCLALGVGPVEFPAYLDRPQIVSRDGENRMLLADFDQWIEPPQDNFKRVLMENLSRSGCDKSLSAYPWPAGIHPGLQAAIQVRRLDGVLGGEAVLAADWSLLDQDGQTLLWRTALLRETANGPGFAAMAEAQSRLVAEFARLLAASLREIPAAPARRSEPGK